MSFASDVKNEILSAERSECCRFAMDYAMILFGRDFSAEKFSLLTANEAVASAYSNALFRFSGVLPESEFTNGGNYRIMLSGKERAVKVLDAVSHSESVPKRRINFANLREQCCFASFIAGVFLVCGTVTNPDKDYHLEFAVPTKGLCDDLAKLFDEFEPVPKTVLRAGSYMVYFKNSSEIEDILAFMGAAECSMAVMGAKMFKDVRNTVNRKVNFENANMARTVAAAGKQFEAILFLKEKVGLDNLPKELQEIAALRLENRELSNSEISKLLSEKLSVSGVTHRFRRLIKMADELK